MASAAACKASAELPCCALLGAAGGYAASAVRISPGLEGDCAVPGSSARVLYVHVRRHIFSAHAEWCSHCALSGKGVCQPAPSGWGLRILDGALDRRMLNCALGPADASWQPLAGSCQTAHALWSMQRLHGVCILRRCILVCADQPALPTLFMLAASSAWGMLDGVSCTSDTLLCLPRL